MALGAAAPLTIGQYNSPRDFTLRITDPFPPENPDLIQPVVGKYTIRILPPQEEELGAQDLRFLSEGLFFKQVGEIIYVDIRKPPSQTRAGYYDLSVTLSLPQEGDFHTRQPKAIRYVDSSTDVLLLLDNSSSMKKNDPHRFRYAAAENFVRLATLSNKINKLALLKFSSSTKIIIPWTAPSEVRGITQLLEQQKTGNFTNINDAFEVCARLFEDSLAQDKILILLTDGKHEPGQYADVHLQLRDMNVRVITVGLSEQADAQMLTTIAEETGGAFFKAVDDEKLLRIYHQIASEISEFKSIGEGHATGEIHFEATSADDIINIDLSDYRTGTRFDVLSPDGRKVDLIELSGRQTETHSTYRLLDPKPGIWRIVPNKQDDYLYTINTHSPLFLKIFPVDKKVLKGQIVHFAASLAQQDIPVCMAAIQGKIVDAQGEVRQKFILYDDGVHGDNHAEDGVYGAIIKVEPGEGAYQLVVEAHGQSPQKEGFVRIDSQKFRILETSDLPENHFVASVLPLYIDLGKVESGITASASLRLSFQGPSARNISLEPGDPLTLEGSAGQTAQTLDWKVVSFPEPNVLEPTLPHIYSLRLLIPKDAPLGAYSGTVRLMLEDQEIGVPMNFVVVPPSLKREPAVLATRPVAPIQPRPELHDLTNDPAIQELTPELEPEMPLSEVGPTAKPQPVPITALLAESEKDSAAKIPLTPAPPTVHERFSFAVEPGTFEEFSISKGQQAVQRFTLINLSSTAGLVRLRIARGEGEFDTDQIHLEPRQQSEVLWSWQPEVVDPKGTVEFQFFDESQTLTRSLSYRRGWPGSLLIFIFVFAFFLASALYHGLRYLSTKRSDHLHLSLSSCAHLVALLLALALFYPRRKIDNPDHPVIIAELIEQDTLDDVQPYEAQRDTTFVEERQAKSFDPTERVPEREVSMPTRDQAQPRYEPRTLSAPRTNVEIEMTLEDRQPNLNIQPLNLTRRESVAEMKTRTLTQPTAQATETELPRSANQLQREQDLPETQPLSQASQVPLARAERGPVDGQREWDDQRHEAKVAPTKVLSLNDRPQNRAVMRTRPQTSEASSLALQRQDHSSPEREQSDPAASQQKMDVPQAPALKTVMAEASPIALGASPDSIQREIQKVGSVKAAPIALGESVDRISTIRQTTSADRAREMALTVPAAGEVRQSAAPEAPTLTAPDRKIAVRSRTHLPTAGVSAQEVYKPQLETLVKPVTPGSSLPLLEKEETRLVRADPTRADMPASQPSLFETVAATDVQPGHLARNAPDVLTGSKAAESPATKEGALLIQSTDSGRNNFALPGSGWEPRENTGQQALSDVAPNMQILEKTGESITLVVPKAVVAERTEAVSGLTSESAPKAELTRSETTAGDLERPATPIDQPRAMGVDRATPVFKRPSAPVQRHMSQLPVQKRQSPARPAEIELQE